jgi:hypothetical protein
LPAINVVFVRSSSDVTGDTGGIMRTPWQEFGWGELDEAGPQTEDSIERGFRRLAAVDDEFGHSESLDPDNVGDIADEGPGHRG